MNLQRLRAVVLSVVRYNSTAVVICAICPWATPSHATEQADEPRLSTKITIECTKTTIGDMAKQVGSQVGLQISSDESISQRTVTVLLTSCPARTVLDSICALTDLVWAKEENGKYIITRHSVRRVGDASKLSSAMASALPRDLRDFLGLESAILSDTHQAPAFLNPRVMLATKHVKDELLGRMAPMLSEGKAVRFETMAPSDQQGLCLFLFCRHLMDVSEALTNAQSPCFMVPERSYLTLAPDGVLLIDMLLRPDYPIGFGVNTNPDVPLGPPNMP